MIKVGDYQRAFDLAAEAAERNPDEARNFFLAGKALVQLGEPTSACAGSSVRSCSTRTTRKRTISSHRPIAASDGRKMPSAR